MEWRSSSLARLRNTDALNVVKRYVFIPTGVIIAQLLNNASSPLDPLSPSLLLELGILGPFYRVFRRCSFILQVYCQSQLLVCPLYYDRSMDITLSFI